MARLCQRRGVVTLAFDFRRNRQTANGLLGRADEFLDLARHALDHFVTQGRWSRTVSPLPSWQSRLRCTSSTTVQPEIIASGSHGGRSGWNSGTPRATLDLWSVDQLHNMSGAPLLGFAVLLKFCGIRLRNSGLGTCHESNSRLVRG